MNAELKKYVNENYKDYSADLFSVFMYRNFDFCKLNGYSAFMTPFVWMFIKTYEKLRAFIINNKNISSLIQMEYSAFEEATVPICAFVLKNAKEIQKGDYIKLSDFKGGMDVQKQKVLEAISNIDCGYKYYTNEESFSKIPSMPIAYWIKNYNIFSFPKMDKSFISGGRNKTHGNEKYVRFFWEVQNKDKWEHYSNGGDFRKYYGDCVHVVDWSVEARSFYESHGGLCNRKFWNKEGITFTTITSATPGFRIKTNDCFYSSASPTIFNNSFICDKKALGFLNSKVASYILDILNPTINTGVNNILSLPYYDNDAIEKVEDLCAININISKFDWDSFETSWDFKKHPLIQYDNSSKKLRDAFENWESFTNKQFSLIKANEEEINRIFIKLYCLEDELSPEVCEKDVTIRKSDLERDIRSFISYAVGCMFGRYSLDNDGLIFTGGEWDTSKYKTFIPDEDNIIPITDDEYFTDDIVGRVIEFIKVIYGEDTLEENLDFIAKALSGKGDTSRQIIRNYFIKDFYKDHVKIYQKKPIYWLFDSGKENGFKALIYMHRYNEDTVARVRADYLHKVQKAIENSIEGADIIIDSATSSTQKAKAVKQKEKLVKQLAETRNYDAAIAHVASKRIVIDLDDGVTVNYAKFQGVEVSREGKKAVKIDLLSKI